MYRGKNKQNVRPCPNTYGPDIEKKGVSQVTLNKYNN